jgi:hypothetical protein
LVDSTAAVGDAVAGGTGVGVTVLCTVGVDVGGSDVGIGSGVSVGAGIAVG